MRRILLVAGILLVLSPVVFDLVIKKEEKVTVGRRSAAAWGAGVVLIIAGLVPVRKP